MRFLIILVLAFAAFAQESNMQKWAKEITADAQIPQDKISRYSLAKFNGVLGRRV